MAAGRGGEALAGGARQCRDGRQITVDDNVDKRGGRLLAVNQQFRGDHIGAGLAG
nr:hypothetical protein BJQ95_02650 [Cryobacterium sp. SO1]